MAARNEYHLCKGHYSVQDYTRITLRLKRSSRQHLEAFAHARNWTLEFAALHLLTRALEARGAPIQ
jgi:hypothetical protein